jgi:DNA repair protein RadC
MKIKDFPKQNRPRERFSQYGPGSLSDAELFALVLRTGSKSENVLDMSNKLISKHGLGNLFDCSLKELQEINGIGKNKAMQILAIAELGKRYSQHKNPIVKIRSAKEVFSHFHSRLKNEKQENFYVLILNSQNIIVKEELISKGVLDSAILHPREVFKPAIKNSASKLILIHNHPSGDPSPSEEDLEITQILVESGNLLGIKILDHVIIGNKKYWSWAENSEN